MQPCCWSFHRFVSSRLSSVSLFSLTYTAQISRRFPTSISPRPVVIAIYVIAIFAAQLGYCIILVIARKEETKVRFSRMHFAQKLIPVSYRKRLLAVWVWYWWYVDHIFYVETCQALQNLRYRTGSCTLGQSAGLANLSLYIALHLLTELRYFNGLLQRLYSRVCYSLDWSMQTLFCSYTTPPQPNVPLILRWFTHLSGSSLSFSWVSCSH